MNGGLLIILQSPWSAALIRRLDKRARVCTHWDAINENVYGKGQVWQAAAGVEAPTQGCIPCFGMWQIAFNRPWERTRHTGTLGKAHTACFLLKEWEREVWGRGVWGDGWRGLGWGRGEAYLFGSCSVLRGLVSFFTLLNNRKFSFTTQANIPFVSIRHNILWTRDRESETAEREQGAERGENKQRRFYFHSLTRETWHFPDKRTAILG